jgi:uncharacterized protein (DUF736 family)
MSQYNNIAVFKNTKRTKDNQPLYNVSIEMADGTKWEGGLWLKTAKSGVEYLGGDLKPPFAGKDEQRRPAPKKQIADMDDDIPFDGGKAVDW